MQQNPMNQPLSDEDMMNDLLSQEKQLVSSYATFLCEASCPNLRNVLTQNMHQIQQDQYQVFDQMRSRGWYTLEASPAPMVNKAKQKMQQTQQQLG